MESEVERLKLVIEERDRTIANLKQTNSEINWLDAADLKQRFNISDATLYRYRVKKKNTLY